MTTLLKSSVCSWNPKVSPLLFVRHIFWGLLPRSPGGILHISLGYISNCTMEFKWNMIPCLYFLLLLINLPMFLLAWYANGFYSWKYPLLDGIWHISISWFIRMSYLLCSLLLVNLPKCPHYLVVSTRHFGMLNSTIINHPMWGKKWCWPIEFHKNCLTNLPVIWYWPIAAPLLVLQI